MWAIFRVEWEHLVRMNEKEKERDRDRIISHSLTNFRNANEVKSAAGADNVSDMEIGQGLDISIIDSSIDNKPMASMDINNTNNTTTNNNIITKATNIVTVEIPILENKILENKIGHKNITTTTTTTTIIPANNNTNTNTTITNNNTSNSGLYNWFSSVGSSLNFYTGGSSAGDNIPYTSNKDKKNKKPVSHAPVSTKSTSNISAKYLSNYTYPSSNNNTTTTTISNTNNNNNSSTSPQNRLNNLWSDTISTTTMMLAGGDEGIYMHIYILYN